MKIIIYNEANLTVPQAIKAVNETIEYLYRDGLERAEVINRDGIAVRKTEDGFEVTNEGGLG